MSRHFAECFACLGGDCHNCAGGGCTCRHLDADQHTDDREAVAA